jgi:hypothetical protein
VKVGAGTWAGAAQTQSLYIFRSMQTGTTCIDHNKIYIRSKTDDTGEERERRRRGVGQRCSSFRVHKNDEEANKQKQGRTGRGSVQAQSHVRGLEVAMWARRTASTAGCLK